MQGVVTDVSVQGETTEATVEDTDPTDLNQRYSLDSDRRNAQAVVFPACVYSTCIPSVHVYPTSLYSTCIQRVYMAYCGGTPAYMGYSNGGVHMSRSWHRQSNSEGSMQGRC